MTKVAGTDNIWEYTVPAGTTGILFNAGDGDGSKTGDMVAVANHLYNQSGDQGVYNGGNGGGGNDPVVNPGTAFKVYFDNTNAKWATPYIHYWGAAESTWPGEAMTKVAGADNIWEYTVPAGTTGILFNAGDGDGSKTGDMVAVANHLYNQSGDQGVYNGGNGGGGDDPIVNPGTYPANLYLIGNVGGKNWASANAVAQNSKPSNGVYVWDNETFDDAGGGFAYFSFLTQLDEVDGDWTLANDADRYGASAEDEEVALNTPVTVVKYPVNVSAMGALAWKIVPGTYTLTVDLAKSTMTVKSAGTVVELLPEAESSDAIYFNLQGQRVNNPEKGIYIKVTNGKSSKVIL